MDHLYGWYMDGYNAVSRVCFGKWFYSLLAKRDGPPERAVSIFP